jgi:hypothetical protein
MIKSIAKFSEAPLGTTCASTAGSTFEELSSRVVLVSGSKPTKIHPSPHAQVEVLVVLLEVVVVVVTLVVEVLVVTVVVVEVEVVVLVVVCVTEVIVVTLVADVVNVVSVIV